MTYHKDGSFVGIGQGVVNTLARNCGWLTNRAWFRTGDNKTEANALKALADKSNSAMMCGHHSCEICGWEDIDYGNGEIWIETNGLYWRMPRMLWHYVETHQYRIPAELDDALHSKKFKIVDTDGWRKGLRVNEVKAPYYVLHAYWNESRYDNLISFSKAIQGKWMTNELFVKNGMYVAHIYFDEFLDLHTAFEEDSENFPNEIRVVLVMPEAR